MSYYRNQNESSQQKSLRLISKYILDLENYLRNANVPAETENLHMLNKSNINIPLRLKLINKIYYI